MATAGDIFKTTLFYSIANSSVAQNVFYYVLEGASTADSLVKTSLETFFGTTWAELWDDIASTDSTLDYGQVDVVNSDGTLNRALGTFDIDVTGILTSETMPAAVSAFLMANTALPKIRGKKYLPGIGEGVVDSGALTAVAVTQLSLMLLQYLATRSYVAGSTLVPGVLSRSLEYFVAFNASGLVNDIPAYQRRRKPGVGS